MQKNVSGELSDFIFSKCCFCGKNCKLESGLFKTLCNLSGRGNFFCGFCLRNRLNTKSNKNVLLVSFRKILDYYSSKELCLLQIEDIEKEHKNMGLLNPIFAYDEESMVWFIDFNRVGNSYKEMPVKEVYKTIDSILNTFESKNNLAQSINFNILKKKYKEAINLFHLKRYRPNNKKILTPNLDVENKQNINLRNFSWNIVK
jgi:hypothetical protein